MKHTAFEHQQLISDSGIVENQDFLGKAVIIICILVIIALVTLGVLTLFF